MSLKVPLLDLQAQQRPLRDGILPAIARVSGVDRQQAVVDAIAAFLQVSA